MYRQYTCLISLDFILISYSHISYSRYSYSLISYSYISYSLISYSYISYSLIRFPSLKCPSSGLIFIGCSKANQNDFLKWKMISCLRRNARRTDEQVAFRKTRNTWSLLPPDESSLQRYAFNVCIMQCTSMCKITLCTMNHLAYSNYLWKFNL